MATGTRIGGYVEVPAAIFYEYCMTLANRTGKMLEKDQFDGKTGFRSVYGFEEATANFFRTAGTTKGAKHFAVYADELYIDIDNDDAAAERLASILQQMRLAFQIWISGSKGWHFHLKHQPVFGHNVPYSHKMWVKSLGIECDWSIYKAGGIFRLPHTRHAKTMKYKTLSFTAEGHDIVLPLVDLPPSARTYRDATDEFVLEDFIDLLSWVTRKKPKAGCRNQRLYALATGLLQCGLKPETCEDLVLNINESLDEPLEEEEVMLLLTSANERIFP